VVRHEATWQEPASDAAAAPRFVAREASERWCEAAIAAVGDGRPHVALVVGEPGAGKTRLLRELGARAVARGVAVSVGRGSEGAVVPFEPLCRALSGALADPRRKRRAPLALDRELLERLVGGRIPRTRSPASRALMRDSARMASSVARAIVDLARPAPLLMVLDDLQWVDHASLDAFELLAFALADAQTAGDQLPLLLVGGLRPPAPEQRLARTLAKLQRESACHVLSLAGFDEDEMAQLLSALGVGPATHQMVALVREATVGNPLFAVEVVRQLQRVGAVKRQGRFFSIVPGAIHIPLPADVRDALTARTAGLDARARELLTLGAVLGDPFELATLRAIGGIERSALDALLDGWVEATLVVSDGARAHFAHPLVRQGLLADLPSTRRQRLHADIAEGLEHLAGRSADDQRLAIAHHLVCAGPAADPARVVAECMRAGELAGNRHSWTDAARFYEAALAAAEHDPRLLSDAARADLHFRAGFAHYRDQDAGSCLAQFEAAIAAARSANDLPSLARALLGRTRAHFTLVSVAYGTRIETDELQAVVEQVAEQDPLLAAFAWSEMAQVLWTAKRPREARAFAQRALAVGTRKKSAMLAAEAHRALSLISAQELDPQGALDHLESGLGWARRGHESWIESQILQRMILPLLWLGKTDKLEAVATSAASSTQLIHDWGDHSLAHGGLTCWAVACGEFDRAEGHVREMLRLMRRSGYPWAAPTGLPAIALGRALRGAWAEAAEALSLLAKPGEVFAEPSPDITSVSLVLQQVIDAWHSPDARRSIVDSFEVVMPQIARAARADIYALGLVSAVVECAEFDGAEGDIAATAYGILEEAHERGVVLTTGWVSLVPRVLGVAATLMQRWDDAISWFTRALESSRALGARVEHLRTTVSFAAMLVRRGHTGDDTRALELLALAVPQLRDLGMSPLLATATALADQLTPPPSRKRRSAKRRPSAAVDPEGGPSLAIMFTDIEGSTAAFVRLGDAAGLAMVHAHDSVVRDWLARCNGTWMKHTGDGILAAFPAVPSALDCAVAIQRAFARHTRRHPHRPLRVRVGINVGQPLAANGDLFGTAVNTAARVCARAKGGEILVTQAVHRLAEGGDFRFRARGRVTLRGLRSPTRVYAVAW
jgi:class 3 adenylate cyclase